MEDKSVILDQRCGHVSMRLVIRTQMSNDVCLRSESIQVPLPDPDHCDYEVIIARVFLRCRTKDLG